jgi:hypothetical protein
MATARNNSLDKSGGRSVSELARPTRQKSMQISIIHTIGHNESLRTEATHVLENLDDSSELHYEFRSRRHPLAIYNTSLQFVSSRLLKVLDSLEDKDGISCFLNKQPTTWWEALAESTDAMLDALMEHMDDCNSVLQAFVPPEVNLSRRREFKAYQRDVGEYRKHIGLIVNYIKHQQGRIRPCVAWYERTYLPGYYIEGPDSKGVLGPVECIHTNGNTAFSFLRDVRYHLVGIYAVSACLSKAIRDLAGWSGDFTQQKPHQGKDGLTRAVLRVAKYPSTVFEDEVNKPWPHLGVNAREDSLSVKIQYPAK